MQMQNDGTKSSKKRKLSKEMDEENVQVVVTKAITNVDEEGMSKSPDSTKKEASDQSPQVNVPVVFYCMSCRTIVADSWALAQTSEPLHSVSFVACENIYRASEATMSRDGLDMGCSYFALYCGHCKDELGKAYFSTSRSFDTFRDLYTFDVDKLGMYRLGMGSYLDGVAPILPVKKPDENLPATDSTNKGLEQPTRGPKEAAQHATFIFDQIGKLRQVVQVLHARLCKVEGRDNVGETRNSETKSSGSKASLDVSGSSSLPTGSDVEEVPLPEEERGRPTTRSLASSRVVTRSLLKTQQKNNRKGYG